MKISVDDAATIARDIDHAKKIIKEYEAAILAENLVISHYLVDGMEVADVNLYLANHHDSDIQHIAIVARTIQEMVQDSIATFFKYLPALQGGLLCIKEKLIMRESVSQDSWQALLDGLEWIHQLLSNLKNFVQVEGLSLGDIATR